MIQQTEYYRKIIHVFNLAIPFTYLFFFESRFQILCILVPYTVLDQSIKDGTVLDKSTTINLVVSVLDIQDIFNSLNNEP